MEMMLKVLHYQGDIKDGMTADKLADLAMHSNKYDCVKALGPWVTLWFDKIEYERDMPKQFGYLILAAYLFGYEAGFANISQKAILKLAPDYFSQWDLIDKLEILPSRLPGKNNKYTEG
jgi:hypothetical protein